MNINNNLVNIIKIAIVGKPNVGKSSFINNIFKSEISIVNKKPQTTRNKLSFFYKYNDTSYFEFFDTPGYHTPKYKLDNYLNNFVSNSLKECDLIYFIVDLSRPITDEDIELISKIINKKIIIIFNKIDLNNNYEPHYNKILNYIKPIYTFFISAIKNDLTDILNVTNEESIKLNHLVHKDLLIQNDNDKFIVSELIRKNCLDLLQNEIPYGIAIDVNKFHYDKQKQLLNINADIVVEKNSHKQIVIGKNGNMIKNIGIISRKQLLQIFDCKIMLNLFVKIDKDWRNNVLKIKEFGYFN